MNRYFFIFFIILIYFVSCKSDQNGGLVEPNSPPQSATNIELIYSDSGIIKMKLTSPLINRFNSPVEYEEFPKGINALFYDDSLHVKSRLKSKYAIRKEDGKIMEAKNDVVVVNEKGEKLNTEHLIWDDKKKMIYTDSNVKITTATNVLYGEGLESNQTFTKYKIKKPKGSIDIKE